MCAGIILAIFLTDQSATAELDAYRSHVSPETSDDLPPFTNLTTDEDWQKKAEYQPPGTYYVVANSDSFAELDEYKALHSPSAACDPVGGKSPPNIPVDDATVILGIFDESVGRPPWKPEPRLSRSEPSTPVEPVPSRRSTVSQSQQMVPVSVQIPLPQLSQLSAMEQRFETAFADPHLRYHYRSFVRRHLLRIPRDFATGWTDIEDLIEHEATYCPPVGLLCPMSCTVC